MNAPFPIIQKYNYPKFDAETFPDGKRLYLTPNGQHVPSVTTILGMMLPKDGLIAWRERVGEERAKQETEDACYIGSTMHDRLEGYVSNYLQGRLDVPPEDDKQSEAYVLADNLRKYALEVDLDQVWGIEEAVYHSDLYAGRTDLIGVFNGKSAVIDYKSSRIWKRPEWIEGYKLQIAAYNLCHKHMFGEGMETGVILISLRPPNKQLLQKVVLNKSLLHEYEDKWIMMLDKFYNEGHADQVRK